ncbi:MAG: sialidase family protein, partial [Planctomycetota bacterium]
MTAALPWSDPDALNSDAATDTANDLDAEIATDGNGTWVVVWHAVDTGSSTSTGIRWARSSDNGATWTDPAALTHAREDINPLGADSEPHLATDGTGTWIIVWTSTRDIDGDFVDPADPVDPLITSDADIFYSVSTDNAETFGSATALNTNNI